MHGLRSALPYCLILLSGLAAICGCTGEVDPASHVAEPRVRVSRPVIRSITDYAYFTGRTDAIESVKVQSRVTGYLVSIDFEPGAQVEEGQRLFLIDPRPYQAAFDRAIGQVNLAEARLELAIADYARALEVAKTPGAISQQDIDKYAAQKNESKAAVAAAKANSESARLNVEFTRIVSPINGIVGRNLLTIGNLIKEDETLLTTVVSQDPMYAYFDIDEHIMLRLERLIREGKIATIREKQAIPVEMGLADEGEKYPHGGVVDFINNRIDPTTGTLQIRGVFSNPGLNTTHLRLLTPGMFVRIRLPIGDPHRAILVPQAAICSDQGNKYLLVVNDEDVVEYRPVTLGPQQPGGLQVVIPVGMVRTKAGLRSAKAEGLPGKATAQSIRADDWIVVDGLQQARPGIKVETHK